MKNPKENTIKYLVAIGAVEDACKLLGWDYARGSYYHWFSPPQKNLIKPEAEALFVQYFTQILSETLHNSGNGRWWGGVLHERINKN